MSAARLLVSAFAIFVVWALLLASRLAGPAQAGALVVDQADPACSDVSGTPYCTIGAAVAAAVAGDTISVYPGAYAESVDLSTMAAPGDITLQAVDGAGAPAVSTVTIASPGGASAIANSVDPFPGTVTIDGFTLLAPDDDGIFLDAGDEVTVRNVTANGNGEDGILIRGNDNLVTVSDSTLNENAGDGLNVFDSNALLTIANVVTNGNDEDGMELNVAGDVEISGSTANGNLGIGFGGNGIDVPTAGEVSITGTTTDGNAQDGLSTDIGDAARLAGVLEGAASVTIVDSSASENGDDGYELESTGDVSVTGSFGADNNDDAFDITGDNLMITGSGAVDNDDHGFELEALSSTSVDESTSNFNSEDGFRIGTIGDVSLDRVTARGNDGDGARIDHFEELGETSITNSVFIDNGEEGIQYNDDELDFNTAGPHVANGNIICGNSAGGLDLDWLASVNAEGNWWGAGVGPDHPSNAGATGDEVFDGANQSAGIVDFDPWIDTITGTNGEATVGSPTVVTFEFTGGDGAVALMEGPGDPNGVPLFMAETDNGAVTHSGFIEGGVFEVTVTPANAGTATVTVNGPCALTEDLGGNSVELVVIAGIELVWGDNDCSGSEDAVDALKNLQELAGLPYGQNDPCFALGEPVGVSLAGVLEVPWGDVDCDGDLDSADALGILRSLAALPVNQEEGCPMIGDVVLVAE
jgi:hypothetical protein